MKREVEEETAFPVSKVADEIPSFSYSIDKKVEQAGEQVVIKKTTLQLNFVCEVIQTEFRVNPEEVCTAFSMGDAVFVGGKVSKDGEALLTPILAALEGMLGDPGRGRSARHYRSDEGRR